MLMVGIKSIQYFCDLKIIKIHKNPCQYAYLSLSLCVSASITEEALPRDRENTPCIMQGVPGWSHSRSSLSLSVSSAL